MQESSNKSRINFLTDTNIKASIICPLCNLMARHSDDSESIKNDGACTECYLNFAHSGQVNWELGERPSSELAQSKITHIFKKGGAI